MPGFGPNKPGGGPGPAGPLESQVSGPTVQEYDAPNVVMRDYLCCAVGETLSAVFGSFGQHGQHEETGPDRVRVVTFGVTCDE